MQINPLVAGKISLARNNEESRIHQRQKAGTDGDKSFRHLPSLLKRSAVAMTPSATLAMRMFWCIAACLRRA